MASCRVCILTLSLSLWIRECVLQQQKQNETQNQSFKLSVTVYQLKLTGIICRHQEQITSKIPSPAQFPPLFNFLHCLDRVLASKHLEEMERDQAIKSQIPSCACYISLLSVVLVSVMFALYCVHTLNACIASVF